MHGIELRQALRERRRVYGIALEGYGQPRWPRMFAEAGLDYVFIESEHTPQNRETISWACQAYAANNVAPLVRIPGIDAARASMVVDAGAHGVIVPYVETVEQVRAVVGATKYRPLKGQQLAEVMAGDRILDDETQAYLANFNRYVSLVIMIESPAGIKNLADMLAVGGVDCVLIGPHDLSVSLGIPEQYDLPVFIDALQEIIGICKDHETSVGIHYFTGSIDRALEWQEWGFNFISQRSDTQFIAAGAANELDYIRRHFGDSVVTTESADPFQI